MNKNYAIINDSGTVVASTYVEISQGNNKVDELYIGYENYTSADGYVTVAALLPDNTVLPELSTSNAEFHYGSYTYNTITHSAKDYEGFKIVLTDALTSQAGTLKLTIRLKNNTTNIVLCSSIVNLTIHTSVMPSTPTITDEQYDAMLQTITDNYNTLNTNKLDKVFTNYSEASSINANNDKVILNQSNTPKYAKLGDIYNIISVNSITPTDRNIELDSGDIPYDDTTVGDAIDSLKTNVETRAYKYQLDDKVGHRDGTLSSTLPSASEVHGLLPYDVTKISNYKIEITLDGYNFALGDIFSLEIPYLANGSFVHVIDDLNTTLSYNCLLVNNQSISYCTLSYKLQNDKITIESSLESFMNLPRISIVRP